MGTHPHTLKVTMTGDDTYDAIEIPGKLRRLSFWSLSGSVLLVKFAEAADAIDIETDEIYDSDWLPEVWDNVSVYINGSGDIAIEYWT